MEKCLLKTIDRIVDNDSLVKFGEFFVEIPSSVTGSDKKIYVGPAYGEGDLALRIVGNGYFTDSTLQENKGKNIVIRDYADIIYLSSEVSKVGILGKYELLKAFKVSTSHAVLNINDLNDNLLLTELNVQNSNSYGELSDILNENVKQGRTSGTFVVTAYNNIKLNGSYIQGQITIKFGTDMVNPTSTETAQGWQVAS